MGIVHLDISISLDGFVTGPGDEPDVPLGVGGERLHAWFTDLSEQDGKVIEDINRDVRAIITGRRNYDNSYKWWGPGKGPVGDIPVIVLSHSVPDDPALEGSPFTFVTDGVTSALEQAQRAAGDGEITIMGGPNVAQQFLRANLVDLIHLHVAPVILGGGKRLFDDMDDVVELQQIRVVESEKVTHLSYRVVK